MQTSRPQKGLPCQEKRLLSWLSGCAFIVLFLVNWQHLLLEDSSVIRKSENWYYGRDKRKAFALRSCSN